MNTFTNEECLVMVHAVNNLAQFVKVIADHIEDDLPEDTFKHYADAFRDCSTFVDDTKFQLDKIMKRLQE